MSKWRLLSDRGYWLIWLAALCGVSLIHSATLTISPTIWQDEVQLIEYGRTFIEPDSDWSVNWWGLSRPLLTAFYPGPLLQEAAFRLSGGSMLGPRVSSLFGALLAATTALLWLLSRGTPRYWAMLCGLLFLLDPIFVQSYRGARIDCWALASCFASCWQLRRALGAPDSRRLQHTAIAGALSATAFIIWPSAVIVYPLIAAEFYSSSRPDRAFGGLNRSLASQSLSFIGGCFLASALLIAPALPQFMGLITGQAEWTYRSSISGFSCSDFHERLLEPWTFIRSFRVSPILPLAGLFCILCGADLPLIVSSACAAIFLHIATVYPNRILYLLPYLLALCADFRPASLHALTSSRQRIGTLLVILTLCWALAASMIFRPAIAHSRRSSRDPSAIYEASLAYIGRGSHKVVLFPIEFYYAGRRLGWRMYWARWFKNDALTAILSSADFAILSDSALSPEIAEALEVAGLHSRGHIGKTSTTRRDSGILDSWVKTSYSPYIFYAR
ncbi:MAG TPA: hypothetical protein DCM05_11910 [Elusimicrobia bacterium]|nr:hypothetical protein [Elusimicrobiota bacterium]